MEFNAIYRAICVGPAVLDKKGTYRILVRVPGVSGDEPVWAEPCLPVTFFETPKQHAAHSHTVTVSGTPYTTTSVTAGTHTYEKPIATVFPKINQGVWVMYENGDPNYPVWMGIYDKGF